MVALFAYCIPGFISFKDLALAHGLHFIPNFAWIWTAVGFVVFGVTKFSFRQSNTSISDWSTTRHTKLSTQNITTAKVRDSIGQKLFKSWALTFYSTFPPHWQLTSGSITKIGFLLNWEEKENAPIYSESILTGPQELQEISWNFTILFS